MIPCDLRGRREARDSVWAEETAEQHRDADKEEGPKEHRDQEGGNHEGPEAAGWSRRPIWHR